MPPFAFNQSIFRTQMLQKIVKSLGGTLGSFICFISPNSHIALESAIKASEQDENILLTRLGFSFALSKSKAQAHD